MPANITSRLASAFAAGKREGLEEAAREVEKFDPATHKKPLAERLSSVCAGCRKISAARIRALSSAPPPATAQPRSEEGGDDAYPDITDEQFAAIKQSVIDLNTEHQRKIIDGLEQAIAVARGLRKPARCTTYTTPSQKPEDALREAAGEALKSLDTLVKYGRWQISDESPGWHPTLPSAVFQATDRADKLRAALAKEGK